MDLKFLNHDKNIVNYSKDKRIKVRRSSYDRELYECDKSTCLKYLRSNIGNENVDTAFYTSTCYRYFDRHICMNDCDSDLHLITTINTLNMLKVGHAVIASSHKDKYWVITDIVDNFQNCLKVLNMMRGDDKYRGCVAKFRSFHVRITPKTVANIVPKVIDNKLKNTEVIDFVKNLESFWAELTKLYGRDILQN